MIDILALAVSHALLAIAVWRLLQRDDLCDETAPGPSAQQDRKPVQQPGRKPDQKPGQKPGGGQQRDA
jgi:hypothetical protein